MKKITLGTVPGTAVIFDRWPARLELKEKEINLHKHILGIAGSGKSKLLESLFLQSFRQGIPVSLIDPHGSSVEAILSTLIGLGYFDKEKAFENLLYVEFADSDYCLPFNILRMSFANPYERVKLVIESFKRVWPELNQAAMFDTIMDASIKTLIENDLSLAALNDLLSLKTYRDSLLLKVSDPMAVNFFRYRWDKMPPRDQMIQGGAAIRRAYLVVSSPISRLTLGQKENALDFRKILDSGVSVLVNLGKVRDLETKRLLGAILTYSYELAAMSRLPYGGNPHQLLIDEFSLFSAQSAEALSTMLDQTRKAGLFLTMAHQTWSQTNARLTGALQNAMVKISFRVGHEDAPIQAKAFADYDPAAIKKAAVSPTGQPIMMTVQDQYEAWAGALRNLPPRRCLVKIGTRKAVEIETLTVIFHFRRLREKINLCVLHQRPPHSTIRW